MTRHVLPELPFSNDALAPAMSAETLEYHHGKHHAAYINKLNELIEGTEHAEKSLEDIITSSSGGLFNQAAQHYNHSMFWTCLSPNGGGEPSGALAEAINGAFGSFAAFKDEFTKAAATHFGSGWAWLCKTADGSLAICTTSDAGCPLTDGHTPLMVCDVWEHAYYIDYRNKRPAFIDAFWSLVNWDAVAGRL